MFGHTGERLAPHDLWSAWTFEPGIVLPLLVSGILYAIGARRSLGLRTWEKACFWSGWLALVIALVSPLHPLGEELFSAHMTQHEVLMVIAAPLLVLGRPMVPLLWGLPFAWRKTAGNLTKAGRFTSPMVAWIVHAVALWGWHIPLFFQATLKSDVIHSAQHVSFLLSAVLFWWALFRGGHAMAYGPAVLYVFTTAIYTSILGALLTFSTSVWYPAYSGRTTAWGLTPLEDQQIGGLIMWVPAGVVYTVAGLALFAMWLRESGSRAFEWRPNVQAAGVLCSVVAGSVIGLGCRREVLNDAAILTGGNPMRGKDKIQYYGCPTCHTIPGIRGADGLVGPSLDKIARRVYVGGVLANTPDNMMRWIRNPRAVDQLTAMPNMNVSAGDARDIAGYLYTLR
jgi:cytochrome c oxidase assembly factor CtaG/cytochrome c551/c552